MLFELLKIVLHTGEKWIIIVINLNSITSDVFLNAVTKQELLRFQKHRRNPYEVRPRNLAILEELLKCAV